MGPTFGLVTFTLPYELRTLTWFHQKVIYSILFACVASTLKDFGLNPDKLGAQIGMTAVLHTHNRKLDYHPHIHVVVPGGGINKAKRQWIKLKGAKCQPTCRIFLVLITCITSSWGFAPNTKVFLQQ